MKRTVASALLFFVAALSLFAQDAERNTETDQIVQVTGNLNTIYTFGNAGKDQMLGTGTGPGAYEELKNGFFLESNLYIRLRPVSFLEGYFKLYTIARPGSFYVPLSIEPKSEQSFGLTMDRMYGRVNVFEALDLSLPLELYLKTGKYKGESARYQVISKFGLENNLYKMETANTYNYEVETTFKPLDDDSAVSASFIGNYRFDEGIPRLYDNDGGVSDHGAPVLSEYAPQFMCFLRFTELDLAGGRLNAELVYGQNVADIYSGHSAGFDVNYVLPINEAVAIPIGLGFVWHEKNIDMLSRSASYEMNKGTVDFRNTISTALALGARFKTGSMEIDGNLVGVFSQIEHMYRDPLQIISGSAEVQVTFLERYFLGAGLVAGTLMDAQWKTKDDPTAIQKDGNGFDHTFSFSDNFGYEIYGGINLWDNSRFVIGFNQNRGIAMNYNLENKAEGLMKYRLADSDLSGYSQYETGGLFLKFVMNW